VRVVFQRLPEQIERAQNSLSVPGLCRRSRPQTKVVRGHIVGRTLSRAKHFRRLQGRLDHSSDTQRDTVLKFKYILHWTVKAIGPKMSAADRVNQLCGNAHAA